MKKWIFFYAILAAHICFAVPIQERTIDRTALSQLTSALDIPESADLIAETQRRWLRRPHQELWEVEELSLEQRTFVLDWAKKEGLYAPWQPARTSYDKALIVGATTPHMQKLLNFLGKLWEQGIRFQKIVWLAGERPLDKRIDGLHDRCRTEAEAARLIWQETSLPEEMRRLPVVFIAAPMKIEGGQQKRPSREDTITAWLAQEPEPCCALFVSAQPFCGYQHAVLKTALPSTIDFDVVGQGFDPAASSTAAAVTLDSLARWLYQENKN